MKAIAVKSFKTTPELIEIAAPRPKQNEVLVRLSIAGMNPFDWKVADGMLDGQVPAVFPLVLGFDGAGTVEAVGEGTKRFKVGDQVFGQFWQVPLGRGTYAEFCAVSEDAPIAKRPTSLDITAAAALPTAGMAAFDLLEKSALKSGDTVLIVGATGGVGQFLTQLASQKGVQVIATGTAKDIPTLKELGATIVVDFTRSDLRPQIRQQFPFGIEGLLDLVSDATGFAGCTELVHEGGVALTTNYAADERQLSKNKIRGGNFMLAAHFRLVERLGETAAQGSLKVEIEKRVPFEEAISAIAAARTGHARGKTVIAI